MRRSLWRSTWVKLLALVVAVVVFVLMYETQTFDSREAPLSAQDAVAEPGEQLSFRATAYCKGTTTASGVQVRSGIVAADPELLPVGSVISLVAGDDRYDGVYTVLDTGPRVQGRLLDLYIWSCFEALRFGRRAVQVTVLRLGWDPKASAPGLADRLFKEREAAQAAPPEAPAPAEGPIETGEPVEDPPVDVAADADPASTPTTPGTPD